MARGRKPAGQTYEQSGEVPDMHDLVEVVAAFESAPLGIPANELGSRCASATGEIVDLASIHGIVVACKVDQTTEEMAARGEKDYAWYSPAELVCLSCIFD